jgi:hypothetical protein
MIQNALQLYASLHQLSSFVDMLEALRMDCVKSNDFTLFPLVSEGYLHQIQELNADIKSYLQEHSEADKPLARSAS